MRIELRGGVWKAKVHGQWVRYEPADEKILKEAEALEAQKAMGNLSGRSHSPTDRGARARGCGSASRARRMREYAEFDASWRRHVREKGDG